MFRYELDQTVRLPLSDESGIVIGRAQYTDANNNYLVRYRSGDGRQVECWHTELAIEAIMPPEAA
jgi:hypothetical protein